MVRPRYLSGHPKPIYPQIRWLTQRTDLEGGPAIASITTGSKPATLRARAVLSLCSIYALRSSEVARLRLSDFDWRDETFAIKRSKRGGLQHYPIQYEVGETILRYLRNGRPRCSCRHVFVTLHPPFRPLQSGSLLQIVSRRIKQLGISSRHMGPHALRHYLPFLTMSCKSARARFFRRLLAAV